MAKKKKTVKRSVKAKTTTKATLTNVVIGKVLSGNPYVNEWHIAEKCTGGYKNLVKVLQVVTEQIVNGQQGPVKQKTLGQYEFYTDDFFADGVVFHTISDNVIHSRMLKTDDGIYQGYQNILNQRKKMQIEMEAHRKLQAVEQPSNVTEMTQ